MIVSRWFGVWGQPFYLIGSKYLTWNFRFFLDENHYQNNDHKKRERASFSIRVSYRFDDTQIKELKEKGSERSFSSL